MEEKDFKNLSDVISKKLRRPVSIVSKEEIGGGYHSVGYKLSTAEGERFFLKHIRSHDLGFEFPERKISSLLVSNSMGRRSGVTPAPIGVLVMESESIAILPEITAETQIFHLQEFGDGGGASYSQILKNNSGKRVIDDEDIKQLKTIASMLHEIHAVKHPTRDVSILTAVYNDGIRSVLTNPELSIMVLSEFPSDYPVLDLEEQKEVVSLLYQNIKRWMGRHDRLSALHGDFWGANIFLREDGSSWVIDFSRIPWGDPGIDVGWFLSEIIWNYHSSKNPYFKDLAEAWLDAYQNVSGDTEIRKAVALALGWSGIVQVYPRWFPDIDVQTAKTFIKHIKKILNLGEFCWD